MSPLIPAGSRITSLKDTANALANRAGAAWDAFNGRSFGPGVPLQPIPDTVQAPNGQSSAAAANPDPRLWEYPASFNTVTRPRSELSQLTPFEQLRNLASLYDVARICVSARQEEFQGLEWSIKAKVSKEQTARQSDCDEVTEFWRKPDRQDDFDTWLNKLLEDLFVLDAPAIYKRPDMSGKRLYGLDIIDGATIKPVLDIRGRTVAYQQILYGFPHGNYSRSGTGQADSDPAAVLDTFSPNEIIYKPRWTRSFTPYGFPPSEWVILRVNTALRKQSFDLRYFTDGNIPDVWVQPADDKLSLNPQQVRAFEEMFNADLQGNDAARRKAKFLAWRADVKEMRPFSYDTKLDEWMMKITCAAYGVTPAELGFTADVNRATADSQENITYRRGFKPLAVWLKRLFDRIIQEDLGFPDLEWHWAFGESEDKLTEATTDQIYLGNGVVSADEIRAMRFGGQLEGPSPATLAAKAAQAKGDDQTGQDNPDQEEGEGDEPADSNADETDDTDTEDTAKAEAAGDIAKQEVQQPGVGRGHGRHHTGPLGHHTAAWKGGPAKKGPGSIGFGRKTAGPKTVGTTRNTNSASFGQAKEKVRGSKANPNHTKPHYYTGPKGPKVKPGQQQISSNGTSDKGVKYGKTLGAIEQAFADIHKVLGEE